MLLKSVEAGDLMPVAGTVFHANLPPEPQPDSTALEVTGIAVPAVSEADGKVGWRAQVAEDGRLRIAVCHALGDGEEAAEVTRTVLGLPFGRTPAETLTSFHVALFGTVGAAALVVEIDAEQRELWFAGTGDVTLVVAADGVATAMPSQFGTLGLGPPVALASLRSHRTTWERDLRLLIHTAGVDSPREVTTSLAATAHPALACATLVKDHLAEADEACVVAARIGSAEQDERIDGMMLP